MEKKKKRQVPHVYALLIGIVVICAILTYIVPAGSYEMMTLKDGREVVDPNSFQYTEQTPVDLMGVLSSVFRGMLEAADIIFLIFIFGGCFGVITDTGALEAGLVRVTKFLAGKEAMIIPVLMVLFSLMGAIVGSAEDLLPYVPILVSLCVALGFDSITGTAIVLCGGAAGFTSGFLNAYTVGVAQGIAGLHLFSGLGYRLVVYAAFVILTVGYVYRYARKIKKNPTLSSMHDVDQNRDDKLDLDKMHEFGLKEKLVLLSLLVTIILLIIGTVKWGWYFEEIAALFFGLSIVSAIFSRMSINQYAISLGEGMAGIAMGALVCGFARGITVVLTDGNILHTILHSIAGVLSELPSSISALGMYVFQCLLDYPIPSGSGQASVTMPIMAHLADLTGVTRQTSVLAFQLGDGISNVFSPTSGYFMAALALAKIPFEKWVKWILPLIGLQYLLGAVLVLIAQFTSYGPF
ncbi:MAG: YfcC family protein [Anaerovoracaceae bacterium]